MEKYLVKMSSFEFENVPEVLRNSVIKIRNSNRCLEKITSFIKFLNKFWNLQMYSGVELFWFLQLNFQTPKLNILKFYTFEREKDTPTIHLKSNCTLILKTTKLTLNMKIQGKVWIEIDPLLNTRRVDEKYKYFKRLLNLVS